jgi:7,8-dihydropterin-6-yl-methyl-4-(beta-D-ribofuranosyl)aminobenzene 5'-phosphate synthase
MTSSGVRHVEKVRIWIRTDNYYDALRRDGPVMKRRRVSLGASIHAEHGLSYYAETVVDGAVSGCMFDYGLDPVGVLNNVAVLGLDVAQASAFALSHGHFDHWKGAAAVLKHVSARIRKGTPIYVGADTFAERYAILPGSSEPMFLGQLKKQDVEACGLEVVEVTEPMQIIPRRFLDGTHRTGHAL